ncbi:MAG: two-component system, NarL family, nitrate/nitrite response regulator NarL [Solirubrobacteraceae bacterium]|jgi:two-component system nitrate/nitrite response regulator NarL|nr:two-component system, NarL family, nitrate/nitrite response regulator NarL [Solirubrobacteraceae bacterium]
MAHVQTTTVVVADDHPVYRSGLLAAIGEREDLELLAACSDGREAVERIRALRPDVALLDVRMPRLDGLAALEELGGAGAGTKVVFLSAFEDGDSVFRALSGGAAGYLSKEADRDDICDALVAAGAGETVLSPGLHTGLLERLRRVATDDQPALSDRETEILRLTARGMSGPEIAERLGIASTTVKTHLQRAYRKLGVSDRAALVAEAMRRGLLS